MVILRVTVVGQDLFKIVKEKIEATGLTIVNQINSGMLGNLKMLTYAFELSEDEVIDVRKKLMEEMAKDNMRLMPM